MPDRDELLRIAGAPEVIRATPFVPPKPWPRRLGGWNGEPASVLLAGPVGTGKSMMAAELLWRAHQRQKDGPAALDADGWRLVPQPPWARWFRASKLPGLWWDGALDVATRCVVLDDWGHGHKSDAAWEAITEVYILRYERNLPTILTTNLTVDRLKRHAPAMWDRVRSELVVPMVGKSRRASQ